MSFFSTFALSFGAMLALCALVASWLFRTSEAPLWGKLAIPITLVVLACATPYQVATMMGYPVVVPFSALPHQFELIAFVPHDQDGRVDLWLRQGDMPRAYETTMDGKFKEALQQAQARLGEGNRVMLKKGRPRPGYTNQTTPDAPYELDDSAFALPKKEETQ